MPVMGVEGILYQTTRGSYRSCVFVGKEAGVL